MYYSAIGLLAVMILLIENHDIFLEDRDAFVKPAWRVYRRFLFAVLAYYVTDILWGFLESGKLARLLFADTTVYFIAMAAGVLFWAQFMVTYPEEETPFGRALVSAGRVVAGLITLLSVVNIFEPVLFTVDRNCVYRALPVRYVILAAQILMLLLISGYAFSNLRLHREGREKRYRALGLFGLIMAFFLFIQLWFPYLPLYSIAYLLGTCLLHTFVVSDEREEYERSLDEAKKIKELRDTIVSLLDNMPAMTFTKDAGTGVYIACNQAFADYAHKESPADAIGHTDAELFDPETAEHFAEEDRIALSMEEPYVFFEEAQDALGNRRQLQTTKLKYYNFSGQLCVLGMCQDVTDVVRVQRENATTKDEYEKARSTGIIYNYMSQALARGYSVMYYVNVDSEEYIKYRNVENSGALTEEERGYHFFEECRLTAERLVHPDDRTEVVRALKRKTLMAALEQNKAFVTTFRILLEGEPRYVTLKVTRTEDDERYIILGVTDVDETMRNRRAVMQVMEEQIVYTRLKALNGNYLWVYVVEPETGRFHALSATNETRSQTYVQEGRDFFAEMRETARINMSGEDLYRFLASFTQEEVMEEIARRGMYTLHHRIFIDGEPTYVILKAATVEEKDGLRLIVGLIDVDDQTRLEEKNEERMAKAQVKASVDALTGVKNKHAYLEAEERLNTQIAERQAPEFAVTLLDVNDLKKINDSEGHSAGDAYIRDACKIICDTFKHSPVFRVGGDEFAVISRGEDYARIDELVGKMNEHNKAALRDGGVVIACGMAKFDGDESVATVFERADESMYENKSDLKTRKA